MLRVKEAGDLGFVSCLIEQLLVRVWQRVQVTCSDKLSIADRGKIGGG